MQKCIECKYLEQRFDRYGNSYYTCEVDGLETPDINKNNNCVFYEKFIAEHHDL